MKKAILVKSRREYRELMKHFEKKGIMWQSGCKATGHDEYWDNLSTKDSWDNLSTKDGLLIVLNDREITWEVPGEVFSLLSKKDIVPFKKYLRPKPPTKEEMLKEIKQNLYAI